MKTAFRNIVAHTYKPLLVKYLSRTRIYKYGDIRLEIPPQVFHPGFFFSTRLLLDYILTLSLQGKKLLEPGCGSGLISICTSKKGANVTASDINPVAIEFLKKNSRENGVDLEIIESDLFRNVPEQHFDIIAINPPYYKKQPESAIDHAWFCGENGEYFSALFENLENYIHPGSEIIMVLFEGCDMDMVKNFASQNGFGINCVQTHKNLLEKNFIFKIVKKNSWRRKIKMTEPVSDSIITHFEDIYFRLRQKEGRVYTDEELVLLPEISKTHSHYQEWRIRENSATKLLKYFSEKKKALKILELGCGNGWLSAWLSSNTHYHITGIDINSNELHQAKRVFQNKQNLAFYNCNLKDEILKGREFDMIVFAASIQYFASLQEIIQEALDHLLPGGEIHIFDTVFYKQNELVAARQRSLDYYTSLGFPEMSEHYFHHSLNDLHSFNYSLLNNPDTVTRFFKKNNSPFHWICIKEF